jgi:hypothetical protein
MRIFSITACAGLIALAGLGAAQAQAQSHPIQGTPESLFPFAKPNEVRVIDGVPCRTMYGRQLGSRVPIACDGDISVRRIT